MHLNIIKSLLKEGENIEWLVACSSQCRRALLPLSPHTLNLLSQVAQRTREHSCTRVLYNVQSCTVLVAHTSPTCACQCWKSAQVPVATAECVHVSNKACDVSKSTKWLQVRTKWQFELKC